MDLDLYGTPAEAAEIIAARFGAGRPSFQVYRSILQQPSWYAALDARVTELVGDRAMAVDLYTLLYLVRAYATNPDLHGQGSSEYAHAEALSVTADRSEGLVALWQADGRLLRETGPDGQRVFRIGEAASPYLYVDVDNAFDPTRGLVLEIECVAPGTCGLVVEYDSSDASAPHEGAYKPLGQGTRLTAGAHVLRMNLPPDRLFKGRQNGGADFRLCVTDGTLLVAAIRLAQQ